MATFKIVLTNLNELGGKNGLVVLIVNRVNSALTKQQSLIRVRED